MVNRPGSGEEEERTPTLPISDTVTVLPVREGIPVSTNHAAGCRASLQRG